jgi:excisionase family DNA binding protein
MTKLLLTPEETANLLSLGRTKVYQLIAEGTLRSVRIGKCRRVPTSALLELIDSLVATKPESSEAVTLLPRLLAARTRRSR